VAKSIEELLAKRPVDRAAVDAHKKRMVDVVRADRLRELREASELTQVELAGRLHVSQNRVSRIEHGDIDRAQVDTLRKYVEALGGRLRVEGELGDERIQITRRRDSERSATAVVLPVQRGSKGGKKGVCTLCTPWASDSVVPVPDRAGLRLFPGRPVFAGAGMQFESHLGHSIPPRQRGFCFNVWTFTRLGSL
jgi:DNA-binding XRE family transcriptional regulator